MKKINLKGVSVQTWTRTVVLLLALVSQLLVVLGKKTEALDISKTTEVVSYIFTAIASVWSWWKNNSFTDKAQEADALLNDNGNEVN